MFISFSDRHGLPPAVQGQRALKLPPTIRLGLPALSDKLERHTRAPFSYPLQMPHRNKKEWACRCRTREFFYTDPRPSRPPTSYPTGTNQISARALVSARRQRSKLKQLHNQNAPE